jgi:carbamoyl-phosphate synthase large subunit
MNVQYAIGAGPRGERQVYVIEVNPRASRTVPFVSKSTGVPLAKIAACVMAGTVPSGSEPAPRSRLKLADFFPRSVLEKQVLDVGERYCIKSPVFPWNKFPGVDPVLGPEMRSTGEVMGIAHSLGEAFAKAQVAAGQRLPQKGKAFVSVRDRDKEKAVEISRRLSELGFDLLATRGSAAALRSAGLPVTTVFKVKEGRPNVVDKIKGGEIQLIVNTPVGMEPFFDEKAIRRAAVQHRIPTITTMSAAQAAVEAIAALQRQQREVNVLQQLHTPFVAVADQTVA